MTSEALKTVRTLLSALVALVALGLYVSIYQRTVVPIYAFRPTELYLREFLALSVFLGSAQIAPLSTSQKFLFLSILLVIAPLWNYSVAIYTARLHYTILGPSLTHLFALVPILTLLFGVTPVRLQSHPHPSKYSQHSKAPSKQYEVVLQSVVLSVASYLTGPWLAEQWRPLISRVSRPDDTIVHGLAVVAFSLAWFTLPQTATKGQLSAKRWRSPLWVSALVLAVPLHKLFSSPILSHPFSGPYVHPKAPITIHSVVESVTGLIVVGEIIPTSANQSLDDNMHSVRFLRADHSFLGGVWTGPKVRTLRDEAPVTDNLGRPLGDSVYATFNLQEGFLLAKDHEFKTGLVIGLGAGISGGAFMRHGIDLSIVEIDPAVYDAARTYFGLPDPGPDRVFLEDARQWLTKRRAEKPATEKPLYDFVVHDCFSGGGVPGHIFTLEFWKELQAVMAPDGVLVLNTAGIWLSDSTRYIYHTLMSAFTQCRAFHDQYDMLHPAQHSTDFINVVWMCTSSSIPLEFRPARTSDFLGSPLRKRILRSFEQRDIPLSLLEVAPEQAAEFVLTDAKNPLGELQKTNGIHHWGVMREVMKDEFWEVF